VRHAQEREGGGGGGGDSARKRRIPERERGTVRMGGTKRNRKRGD